MPHPSGLDETDLAILKALQMDGRISNADLARRIGLSAPSTLLRVRMLEKRGFIKQYAAICNAAKLGYPITVYAMVSLSLHHERPIERFRKAVMDIPEVVECYNLTGEFDFLLKIVLPDIPAYERLIREQVSRISGIKKITSSFVLGVTKHTTQIPF